MPHRFYLPHALPNEKILLLVRRHWFVLFVRLLVWTIAGGMPVALAFIVPDLANRVVGHPLGYPLAVLGGSAYYLFIWLFAFNGFVDYFLDVWIVTNERILNIEQQQLFSRVTAEQKLGRIQDVTAEIRGIWETFLHFGDVHIQTAGEQARFVFEQVPNPTEIARQVSSLAENKRHAEHARPDAPHP